MPPGTGEAGGEGLLAGNDLRPQDQEPGQGSAFHGWFSSTSSCLRAFRQAARWCSRTQVRDRAQARLPGAETALCRPAHPGHPGLGVRPCLPPPFPQKQILPHKGPEKPETTHPFAEKIKKVCASADFFYEMFFRGRGLPLGFKNAPFPGTEGGRPPRSAGGGDRPPSAPRPRRSPGDCRWRGR